MAITGINNSSYTSYYASNYKNTVKKTDSEKDSTNTKDGNVTTSTVELKTWLFKILARKIPLYEYRADFNAGYSDNGICFKCIFTKVHEWSGKSKVFGGKLSSHSGLYKRYD